MSIRRTGKWVSACIVPVFVLCMAACSMMQQNGPSGEKALQKRVEAMMEAKVKDDWGRVYEYLEPDYKKKVSKEEFLGIRRKMTVLRYNIKSIEMEPSGRKATVTVKFAAEARGFEFDNLRDIQTWLKKGGVWYEQVKAKKQKPF